MWCSIHEYSGHIYQPTWFWFRKERNSVVDYGFIVLSEFKIAPEVKKLKWPTVFYILPQEAREDHNIRRMYVYSCYSIHCIVYIIEYLSIPYKGFIVCIAKIENCIALPSNKMKSWSKPKERRNEITGIFFVLFRKDYFYREFQKFVSVTITKNTNFGSSFRIEFQSNNLFIIPKVISSFVIRIIGLRYNLLFQ